MGAKNMDTYSTMSYTLPENKNSTTVGAHSPATFTNERRGNGVVKSSENHGRKFLMFHGLILRSQLIELIKNKVFFDEASGVRECTKTIPLYQYVSITGSSLLNSLA